MWQKVNMHVYPREFWNVKIGKFKMLCCDKANMWYHQRPRITLYLVSVYWSSLGRVKLFEEEMKFTNIWPYSKETILSFRGKDKLTKSKPPRTSSSLADNWAQKYNTSTPGNGYSHPFFVYSLSPCPHSTCPVTPLTPTVGAR